jgi:cytochrome c5
MERDTGGTKPAVHRRHCRYICHARSLVAAPEISRDPSTICDPRTASGQETSAHHRFTGGIGSYKGARGSSS